MLCGCATAVSCPVISRSLRRPQAHASPSTIRTPELEAAAAAASDRSQAQLKEAGELLAGARREEEALAKREADLAAGAAALQQREAG